MSHISKISITLTPEMAALVSQAVESGEYASGGELVGEALSEWTRRRRLLRHEGGHLLELWAEGIASGPGRFGDIGAIKAEARRRLIDEQTEAGG